MYREIVKDENKKRKKAKMKNNSLAWGWNATFVMNLSISRILFDLDKIQDFGAIEVFLAWFNNWSV